MKRQDKKRKKRKQKNNEKKNLIGENNCLSMTPSIKHPQSGLINHRMKIGWCLFKKKKKKKKKIRQKSLFSLFHRNPMLTLHSLPSHILKLFLPLSFEYRETMIMSGSFAFLCNCLEKYININTNINKIRKIIKFLNKQKKLLVQKSTTKSIIFQKINKPL